MSTTIDQSFVKQFESDVHLSFQRTGSALRNTVRNKTNIKGKSTTFQKIGKGVAGTKSRHGDVPIMNLVHTPIECTLADVYAGEYIDKLDELKINHDEKMVAAASGAACLGRKTDDMILTAMDATANANNVSTAATWSTTVAPSNLMEAMGKSDVPLNGNDAFSVVCWEAWGDLIALQQFSSADYVGDEDRPYLGAPMKRWLGMIWFPFSGLQKDGGGDFKQYCYHRAAVGHASGQDVQADLTWEGTKQAHLCVYSMSQGVVIIDDTAIIENVYDVTP